MGKVLIVAGFFLAGIGLVLSMGFPLGRLPGDFLFRRESATIFVPLTSSILLSVVLTLVLMVFRR